MTHVNPTVVALGVALVLAFGAGVWKAGSLRSDLIAVYQPRLILAQAGLDEKARVGLQRLAVRVSDALGGLDQQFVPSDVLADPSELLDLVASITNALNARRRLPKYLKGLLKIGPTLVTLLSVAIVSLIVTFAYFSGWSNERSMGLAGLYTTVVLVIAVAATASCYFVLLHLFSGAEILAGPVSS